jgi:anti-sigma factor ChrR (cupin superfamily)
MKTTKHARRSAVAGQAERGVRPAVPERADFDTPHKVTDADLAFPARAMELMPEYSQIPDEFKSSAHPWAQWQAQWFYQGLKQAPTPQPGIDLRLAMRHLQVIQGSYAPKHEHKAAAVAFLASRWLERA